MSAEVALKPWAGDVDRGSKKRSSRFLSKLTRSRTGLLGSMILALVVFCAITAPYLAPFDPNYQTLEDRLIPPFAGQAEAKGHLLGTDHLGRDILSRLIYGSRVSLIVGLTAVTISCFMGCVLGLITGYQGGWIDEVIMRIGDVQLAFPFVLLVIAVVAVVGGGLLNEIIVIGITGWVGYARVIREQVLSAREKEYVEAARAIRVRIPVILFRHILPNVLTPVLVQATMDLGSAILTAAAISFIGLGVQPPTADWGEMISTGRIYFIERPWFAGSAGAAIFLVTLAFNLLGDAVRDAVDPRTRRSAS